MGPMSDFELLRYLEFGADKGLFGNLQGDSLCMNPQLAVDLYP
jgi:hypothetical protein